MCKNAFHSCSWHVAEQAFSTDDRNSQVYPILFCGLRCRVAFIGIGSSPVPMSCGRNVFVPSGSVLGNGVGNTSARLEVTPATGTPESKVVYGVMYCMRTYTCLRNHFGPVATARFEPLTLQRVSARNSSFHVLNSPADELVALYWYKDSSMTRRLHDYIFILCTLTLIYIYITLI